MNLGQRSSDLERSKFRIYESPLILTQFLSHIALGWTNIFIKNKDIALTVHLSVHLKILAYFWFVVAILTLKFLPSTFSRYDMI